MSRETFMREAIRLANQGMRSRQGGPFGCVIVRKGEIVARGANQVTSNNDPTAHAEVTAFRAACAALGTFQLGDCELYTSCEPCPMCLAAIYWARIPEVIYAATREDAAAAGFDDAHIYRELAQPLAQRSIPLVPLLREEAIPCFLSWAQLPDKKTY